MQRLVTVDDGDGDPGELHQLPGKVKTPITIVGDWPLPMGNGALPYNGAQW